MKKKVLIAILMLFGAANALIFAKPRADRLSKAELTYIWETLDDNYAGIDDMEELGLTQKEFFKAKTFSDTSNSSS